MIKMCFLSATLAFAAWAGLATAEAGPLTTELPVPPSLVIPAGGCHSDVREHFVPEVSGSVPHYHAGGDCRPIAAEEERRGRGRGRDRGRGEDCHRDVQRHWVPDHGRVYHSHSRRSCRVILAEEPRARDCHDDVRLHFVPGHGEIYHAHRGRSCQVVEYERHRGPPRPGCFNIGPVTVCP